MVTRNGLISVCAASAAFRSSTPIAPVSDAAAVVDSGRTEASSREE